MAILNLCLSSWSCYYSINCLIVDGSGRRSECATSIWLRVYCAIFYSRFFLRLWKHKGSLERTLEKWTRNIFSQNSFFGVNLIISLSETWNREIRTVQKTPQINWFCRQQINPPWWAAARRCPQPTKHTRCQHRQPSHWIVGNEGTSKCDWIKRVEC